MSNGKRPEINKASIRQPTGKQMRTYMTRTDDEKYAPPTSDQVREIKDLLLDIQEKIKTQIPQGEPQVLTPAWGKPQKDIELKFSRLFDQWKTDTRYVSTVLEMAMHPAYQQIIGMGPSAIPLILNQLLRGPDHWFWALTAITGEDPVPESSRGDLDEMTKAWLTWGRERGYQWRVHVALTG